LPRTTLPLPCHLPPPTCHIPPPALPYLPASWSLHCHRPVPPACGHTCLLCLPAPHLPRRVGRTTTTLPASLPVHLPQLHGTTHPPTHSSPLHTPALPAVPLGLPRTATTFTTGSGRLHTHHHTAHHLPHSRNNYYLGSSYRTTVGAWNYRELRHLEPAGDVTPDGQFCPGYGRCPLQITAYLPPVEPAGEAGGACNGTRYEKLPPPPQLVQPPQATTVDYRPVGLNCCKQLNLRTVRTRAADLRLQPQAGKDYRQPLWKPHLQVTHSLQVPRRFPDYLLTGRMDQLIPTTNYNTELHSC